MSTANLISLVATVVGALGFALAAMQYRDAKRHRQTEHERLAAQEERLKTAVAAAKIGAGTADQIVQRAKDIDVTVAELQSIARTLRGSLYVLASQLENEGQEVAKQAGRQPSFVSERPWTPQVSEERRNPGSG